MTYWLCITNEENWNVVKEWKYIESVLEGQKANFMKNGDILKIRR